MPRNYDEVRKTEDRDFVVHGETFTITHGSIALIGELDRLQKEWLEGKPAELPYSEIAEFAMNRLLMMVDDQNGASSRLKTLIDDGHISYSEIVDSSKWGYELMTGVPTMPPAASPTGPGKTAASSKAG